jgi:hypothetical protein
MPIRASRCFGEGWPASGGHVAECGDVQHVRPRRPCPRKRARSWHHGWHHDCVSVATDFGPGGLLNAPSSSPRTCASGSRSIRWRRAPENGGHGSRAGRPIKNESMQVSLMEMSRCRCVRACTLLHGLLAVHGDVEVGEGDQCVTVAPSSSRHRTPRAQAPCQALDAARTRYPGSPTCPSALPSVRPRASSSPSRDRARHCPTGPGVQWLRRTLRSGASQEVWNHAG